MLQDDTGHMARDDGPWLRRAVTMSYDSVIKCIKTWLFHIQLNDFLFLYDYFYMTFL